MNIVKNWFQRHFSDPQVVILALVLLLGLLVVVFLGSILAPVIAAIVIAYLLEGVISRLELIGVRRWLAVSVVFIVFLVVSFFLLLGVVPLLIRQIGQLIQQLPEWIAQGRQLLLGLPEEYPRLITQGQVDALMNELAVTIRELGQGLVTQSLALLDDILVILVFLVLVPVLVFFFLKDKGKLLDWTKSFLPRNQGLVRQVWHEVDAQMGNYVRGKVLEILVVALVCFIVFELLGLNYAILLATLAGVSTLIPYIGVAVAAVVIALVALFQWGLGLHFAYVMVAYTIIEVLDGNLLVPLLFSEVVNLHPIAIIVAVLVFGGIWGIWGLFFAIPLATLVHAVLRAWPGKEGEVEGGSREAREAGA